MIICIVGKTSSGKDTVAKYIKENYDIDMVVSYSTAKRRPDQVEGVHHYFISDEEMEKLKSTATLIAYSKNDITGIQYCATLESITSDPCIYIINPEGIAYLKRNNIEFCSIYVDCSDSRIMERGTNRGDSILKLTARLSSERQEWESFRDSKSYDYIIDNNGDYASLVNQVNSIMENII